MNAETISEAIKVISENVLTPIIYMYEEDERIEFICFCDRNITMQEIYDTEQRLCSLTGKRTVIADIREFGQSERIDVISGSALIYAEHPLLERVFARSMLEDYKIAMNERRDLLCRQKETGTYYLQ